MSEIERPPRPDLDPTLGEDEAARLLEASRPGPPGPLDALQELPTWLRASVGMAAIGLVLFGGLFAIQGLRPDLDTARLGIAPLALVIAAGAAWLQWSLVSMARPNPHPGRRVLWAGLGVLAIVALAALPVWPGVHVPDEVRPAVDRRCALWASFNGAAVLAVFLLLDRHAGRRLFAGLSATAAAISLAFAVQTLNCPCIDLAHVVLTHGLAGSLAGLALVGIRLGSGASRG